VRTASGVLGGALMVRDGRVAAIGRSDELAGTGIDQVRYPGGVIIPGLRDAHFHPVTYAALAGGRSLKEAADFADLEDRLQTSAAGLSRGDPLVAMRLDDETLAEGRLPTRTDLDAMFPERPVLLHRYCGHIAVANSAALDIGDIGPETPDPPGGSLDRDDHGRPTGILRETAVELVAARLAPLAPQSVTPDHFVAAMHGLAGLGLTSIGAIAGCGDGAWADLGDQVAVIAEAARLLPIRCNVLVIAPTPQELERQAEVVAAAGGHVRFLGFKAFSDGSLGGHTAAMHAPFADRTDTAGTLRLDPAWGRSMADAALAMGGRVAVHAIGDRANARVLDLFDNLVASGADPGLLRVEHASVLGDDEIERFRRSGVTASIQPAFLASETTWLKKRLGPERMEGAYPFRTLRDQGVPLAGGSDCPVEPPHPLWGMATARDRAGIVPAQGLEATDALALFTDWAAASLGEAEPLAIGSPADFVVLDRDPVTASAAEVRTAHVVDTWVGGERVPVPADAPAWSD